MRTVIDTNVVISGHLSKLGNPAKILKAWKQGQFDLIVSGEILQEYGRALRYNHISKVHGMADSEINELVDEFKEMALMVTPHQKLNVVKIDPDDDKFLECAMEGQAEYIISGDPDLLDVAEYKGIQIVTPKQFLAILEYEKVIKIPKSLRK